MQHFAWIHHQFARRMLIQYVRVGDGKGSLYVYVARMYVLKQVLVNKSVFFRPICLRGLKNTKLGSSFVVYGLPCQCDTKYCQYWHTKINAHWLQHLITYFYVKKCNIWQARSWICSFIDIWFYYSDPLPHSAEP